MEVKIDRRANRVIAFCRGRLDAAGARVFEKEVVPLCAPEEKASLLPVILDMAGVDYISSAGIRSLIILAKTAADSSSSVPMGLRLRLVNARPPVQQVLITVGLGEDLMKWRMAEEKALDETAVTDYRKIMDAVKQAFPSPVSDPVKDAYFVHTISRGLDRLDDLKTERPYLGERAVLDYDEAHSAAFPDTMHSVEETVATTAGYLEGMTIWGHPKTQINVGPPPSIPFFSGIQ